MGYSARKQLVAVSRQVWQKTLHTIGKGNFESEQTALPERLVFAGDRTLPFLEVKSSLRSLCRFCDKAKGMILAPLLPVHYTHEQGLVTSEGKSRLTSLQRDGFGTETWRALNVKIRCV